MKPLSATLRLQFHSDFTLDHAVPLVPYFAQLGISHLYASPILKARAGSRHGYDVVDPTQVNPELGGEAALQRLVAALRQHGMGLILDTVVRGRREVRRLHYLSFPAPGETADSRR